jgi:predicted dithiol-disulfide oxidoreductase (DUF899 family)
LAAGDASLAEGFHGGAGVVVTEEVVDDVHQCVGCVVGLDGAAGGVADLAVAQLEVA